MTPTRDQLMMDGTKLCILLTHKLVIEAFALPNSPPDRPERIYYASENLAKSKEIPHEEALTYYIHPSTKDRVVKPTDFFKLDIVTDEWSPEQLKVVYSSPDKIVFEFAYDYKTAPKIKTLSPGERHGEQICKYPQGKNELIVVSFNDEFFLRNVDDKKTKRITSEDAILYYTDPKAISIAANPENIFPSLREISRTTNSVRYRTVSDREFDIKIFHGKPVIEIKQRGTKQLPKTGLKL